MDTTAALRRIATGIEKKATRPTKKPVEFLCDIQTVSSPRSFKKALDLRNMAPRRASTAPETSTNQLRRCVIGLEQTRYLATPTALHQLLEKTFERPFDLQTITVGPIRLKGRQTGGRARVEIIWQFGL